MTSPHSPGMRQAGGFLEELKYIKSPYGDVNTSRYVVEVIKEIGVIPREKLLDTMGQS